METQQVETTDIHYGKNLRRIRKEKGISQESIANKTKLSQQTVSRYESQQFIDDDILGRFAKALEIGLDDIKSYTADPYTVIVENNTFERGSVNNNNVGNETVTISPTFNPVEKIVDLYERLLKTERKNIKLLETRIEELERQIRKLISKEDKGI